MFRIVRDPSSGSTELCLTEITRGGSQIFFVCLVGVWQRNFEPAVCVPGATSWERVCARRQNSTELISGESGGLHLAKCLLSYHVC